MISRRSPSCRVSLRLRLHEIGEVAVRGHGRWLPSGEVKLSGSFRALRRALREVADGHGWTPPGCVEDCAERSGCFCGHAVALDAFVKECVNADAARVRDDTSYAARVVVLAAEHLYRGETLRTH